MDVLLIGADNPVGMAIQAVFAQWGRHRALPLNTAAARWRSERQAKKAARKDKPQAVVDLRLAWQVATDEVPQPLDIERAHWLSKACEHSSIPYLLLSSDRVFAGQGTRSLREFDAPDAFNEPGFQIMEIESRVMQAAPSAIVLRTGPLFASTDNNLLTRMLFRMAIERHATFDDRNVFSPVACTDIARVVVAMLDQLSVGADASGVYHYSSGDRTTEYAFAEAALAAMSQYRDSGDIVISAQEKRPEESVETRVFDCSRLRDSFAIKQVPWRGFMNSTVKEYAESSAVEESKG
ncbi:sugar nucleotide-binding protein [Congregibacter brevis]|uniref:dTDP-4-dehydrorhamnose reductase n=1 Tax=Congregibacter brevis TaxID=3081201 RepID=A0ABZ0IB09_9GAMM|nr:sugar nucleotide-binding protein [Congregibacter sp. IMCC45268]